VKLVATNGCRADTADSGKDWVHEYHGRRRDPSDFSNTDRPPSHIAEAVSQVRDEEPFNLAKYIAAQLRMSCELMKRTLIDFSGMEKFSLHWVTQALAVERKPERIADS
jgi:hypothetical protein